MNISCAPRLQPAVVFRYALCTPNRLIVLPFIMLMPTNGNNQQGCSPFLLSATKRNKLLS